MTKLLECKKEEKTERIMKMVIETIQFGRRWRRQPKKNEKLHEIIFRRRKLSNVISDQTNKRNEQIRATSVFYALEQKSVSSDRIQLANENWKQKNMWRRSFRLLLWTWKPELNANVWPALHENIEIAATSNKSSDSRKNKHLINQSPEIISNVWEHVFCCKWNISVRFVILAASVALVALTRSFSFWSSIKRNATCKIRKNCKWIASTCKYKIASVRTSQRCSNCSQGDRNVQIT